jgi:uncharacterized Zn finger protein
MAHCITHKKCFPTLDVAEDVLIEAQTNYDYAPGSGPIAVYQCEDCGQFHLTSRGPMSVRLAQYLASGAIRRQKEANRWLTKLKRK